jgi:hypothetical protein
MDRLLRRWGGWWPVGIALSALVLAGGCYNTWFTMAYLFKGPDIDAEYRGLKNKTVAVVCRPVEGDYTVSKGAQGLAQEIGNLLKERVSKIKIISPDKVAEWCDENQWEKYPEVGKALEAEIVVGVDLEQFRLKQGDSFYQGRAKAAVRVFDCTRGGKLVWEKHMPQTVYPPNTCIATTDVLESDFCREFRRVLADQIARHFYSHDPHADLSQDTAALR